MSCSPFAQLVVATTVVNLRSVELCVLLLPVCRTTQIKRNVVIRSSKPVFAVDTELDERARAYRKVYPARAGCFAPPPPTPTPC